MQSKYQIIKEFIGKYLDPKVKYLGATPHELTIALVSEITEDKEEMQNFFVSIVPNEEVNK